MLTSRLATPDDIPALRALMADAISVLQQPFLTPAQIVASHHLMGLDTQLIEDGTYFVIHHTGRLAGCGGWSRRATLFGGNHTPGRDPALLNPAFDAARVRAMYTAPAFARQGVGRLILSLCENAAIAEGFSRAQLAATMAGVPLYTACGYTRAEPIDAEHEGVAVPLVKMVKRLSAP